MSTFTYEHHTCAYTLCVCTGLCMYTNVCVHVCAGRRMARWWGGGVHVHLYVRALDVSLRIVRMYTRLHAQPHVCAQGLRQWCNGVGGMGGERGGSCPHVRTYVPALCVRVCNRAHHAVYARVRGPEWR